MNINKIKLSNLQPSQFYISEKKVQRIMEWFNPYDLTNFNPILVKILDGIPIITDGHTRAVVAFQVGIDEVPIVYDEDELDWDIYRKDVLACWSRNIYNVCDLDKLIVSEEEYELKWQRWCDMMQDDVDLRRTTMKTKKTEQNNLNKAIQIMADRISTILGDNLQSLYLYGSVVYDDFKVGWSDIDILCLSKTILSQEEALKLVNLRQQLMESEDNNPYYLCFEGAILSINEFNETNKSRVVYWGSKGQSITDQYDLNSLSMYELIKCSRLVVGDDIRGELTLPSYEELRKSIERHYHTIRKYAVQTSSSLYSCGWMLDIARCMYTLRYNDIISKTDAGKWALKENLCPNESTLMLTLQISENPLLYINDPDTQSWLSSLGPTIQTFANVLEKELAIVDNKCIKG